MSDRKEEVKTHAEESIRPPFSYDLLHFDGPEELRPAWHKLTHDHLGNAPAVWQINQFRMLNELAFKIPASILPSGNAKQDALALQGALKAFVARNSKGNVNRMCSDISAAISANGDVYSPLSRAVIAGLMKNWCALKRANDAPVLSNSYTRDSAEWKALDALAATEEGQLLSGAVFTAINPSLHIQARKVAKRYFGQKASEEQLYAAACDGWTVPFYRFDDSMGSPLLAYLEKRLVGNGQKGGLLDKHVMNVRNQHDSLNETYEDSDAERGDFFSDPDALTAAQHAATRDEAARMSSVMDNVLTPREAQMVRMFYGLTPDQTEHSGTQIGKMFGGISRQAVDQAIKPALNKLRAHMRAQPIPNIKQAQHQEEQQAESPPAVQDISIPDRIIAGCKAILAKSPPPQKGYIAEALPAIMKLLEIDERTLAIECGLYEASIKAYQQGNIVPHGKALKAIKNAVGTKAGSLQMSIDGVIDQLVSKDDWRLAALHRDAPSRLKLVQALGEATTDTYIYDLVDAIVSRKLKRGETGITYQAIADASAKVDAQHAFTQHSIHSYLAKYRDKIENQSTVQRKAATVRNEDIFATSLCLAAGDETLLCQPLLKDIIAQNIPRKPMGEVLDAYVAAGNTDFSELFTQVAKTWKCTKAEVLDLCGVDVASLKYAAEGTELCDDIAAKQSLSREQRDKLVTLRLGKLGAPQTVEALADAACELLSAAHPTYQKFKDNPIVVQMKSVMPSCAKLRGDAPIPKTRVPHALMGCLVTRARVAPSEFFRTLGKAHGDANPTISGEKDFLIIRKTNQIPLEQVENAKIAAGYFSDDEATRDKLALAFLEIGKRQTPDEIMAQVPQSMRIGQAANLLRVQSFMTRDALVESVRSRSTHKSATLHKEALTGFEGKNKPVNAFAAGQMADIFYAEHPDAPTKEKFIAAAQGLLPDAPGKPEHSNAVSPAGFTPSNGGYATNTKRTTLRER